MDASWVEVYDGEQDTSDASSGSGSGSGSDDPTRHVRDNRSTDMCNSTTVLIGVITYIVFLICIIVMYMNPKYAMVCISVIIVNIFIDMYILCVNSSHLQITDGHGDYTPVNVVVEELSDD